MPGDDHVVTERGVDLSLVIPAYNEAERLDAGFQRLNDAIAQGAVDPTRTEFIVVDDGSSDDTAGCAKTVFDALPHVSVIRLPENRGKGAAVRAGVAEAMGRVIAFADADMAIDPLQVPKFVTALDHQHVAIGSRSALGASVDRPSMKRSAMNRMFNHFVNAITHLRLDDTQCGFKAFRAPVARLLFHCSRTERMAFDVEILSVARKLGFSIAEVPVHWSRVEGSRVRAWSDSGSMVRDVLRAGRNWREAPPIAASRIQLNPERAPAEMHFLQTLALTVPVIHLARGDFLVLYPLMSAQAAAEQAARVAEHFQLRTPEPEVISMEQLRALSPLALDWDDSILVTL